MPLAVAAVAYHPAHPQKDMGMVRAVTAKWKRTLVHWQGARAGALKLGVKAGAGSSRVHLGSQAASGPSSGGLLSLRWPDPMGSV